MVKWGRWGGGQITTREGSIQEAGNEERKRESLCGNFLSGRDLKRPKWLNTESFHRILMGPAIIQHICFLLHTPTPTGCSFISLTLSCGKNKGVTIDACWGSFTLARLGAVVFTLAHLPRDCGRGQCSKVKQYYYKYGFFFYFSRHCFAIQV